MFSEKLLYLFGFDDNSIVVEIGMVYCNFVICTGPIHTTGYNLRGLEPASVYEVSVVSRNRFGWSDSSRIVRFATIGESK